MSIRNASRRCALVVTVCSVILSACATPSPPPESVSVLSASPRLQAPDPRLMEPPPEPGSFSASVQRSLQKWADVLIRSPPR